MVVLYIVFFIFCIAAEESSLSQKKAFLGLSLFALALMAAFRAPELWSDSYGYWGLFIQSTPTLANYSITDVPIGYTDRGYYFLSVLVKTFTSNYVVFFFVVAALGYYFVYKGIWKLSAFPLFALALYISRFTLGRQFIQMRAGIALSIVFWGLQYVTKKDLKRFLITIGIAFLFHSSVLLALPLYWMNKIRIKRKHIYWGIAIAYVLAAFFTPVIRSFIADSTADIEAAVNYTREKNAYKSAGMGLANPMVYYQTLVLLIFTYYERRLSRYTKHYITLRNAYFFSTAFLIIFSSYAILSGRGSTVLATVEIVIVPLFVHLFNRRNKFFAYILIGLFSAAWFYLNYTRRF